MPAFMAALLQAISLRRCSKHEDLSLCPPASSHPPQHLPALLTTCSPFVSYPPAFFFLPPPVHLSFHILWSNTQHLEPPSLLSIHCTTSPQRGSETGFSPVEPLHHGKGLGWSIPACSRHREPFSGPFKLLAVLTSLEWTLDITWTLALLIVASQRKSFAIPGLKTL